MLITEAEAATLSLNEIIAKLGYLHTREDSKHRMTHADGKVAFEGNAHGCLVWLRRTAQIPLDFAYLSRDWEREFLRTESWTLTTAALIWFANAEGFTIRDTAEAGELVRSLLGDRYNVINTDDLWSLEVK